MGPSADTYRQVVENANEAIVIVQDGMFVYGNPKTEEMSGYLRQEWANKPFIDVVHPHDREMIIKRHQARLEGREVDNIYDFRMVDKTGRPKWVQINSVKIEWQGRPATLNFLTDVSERKQAAEALVESEERYRRLFDTISDFIYTHDLRGRFLTINRRAANALGYAPEEILGRPISDFMLSQFRQAFYEEYLPQIKNEGVVEGVSIYRAKDGSPRYIEYRNTLIEPEDREPYVSGSGRDITERQKAEDDLKAKEHFLRNVFDAVQDGISVLDEDLTILRANLTMDMWYSHAVPLVGKKCYEVYRQRQEPCPECPSIRALEEGGLQVSMVPLMGPEGQAGWLELNAHPLRDSRGVVWGVVEHARDITKSKRAAEALKESEVKYRTIIESIEDGYYEVDLAGTFTFVNESMCRFFGYVRDELVGMNNREYMDMENAEKVYEIFNQVYRTGRPDRAFDWAVITKDGIKKHVETSVSLMRDKNDQPVGFRGILRDVTERKRAEEDRERLISELEEAQEELRRLSMLDGLTGVANRRYLDGVFDAEWRRARRQNRPLGLIMIDIDSFKKFNDTYGHLAGDDCLRQVGMALQASIRRPGDFLARYGGEEFVVLLPNTPPPGSILVAETIRQAVMDLKIPHQSSTASPWVTISSGVASGLPDQFPDAEALLAAADKALYKAKAGGRNQVVLAEECLAEDEPEDHTHPSD